MRLPSFASLIKKYSSRLNPIPLDSAETIPSSAASLHSEKKINNLSRTNEVCLLREVEIVCGFAQHTKRSKVLFNQKRPAGRGIKPTGGIKNTE